MNIFEQLNNAFSSFITETFNQPVADSSSLLTINTDEQKQQFGDCSTTIALTLSKQLKTSPREIAQKIVANFIHPFVLRTEAAGPGFINISLNQSAFLELINQLEREKEKFFKPCQKNNNHILIEFVSANPTGPLHFGHGRGAIIGDALARTLRFLNANIKTEFYINDAGSQIEKLGHSLKVRYLQLLGNQVELPEDSYHGEYLIEIAQNCYDEFGDTCIEKPVSFFSEFGKKCLLKKIKQTLNNYKVEFDSWFSEKTLHDSGAIDDALKQLESYGFLYTQNDASWFKSTLFGDDKDRVVRKANGELTYVAADIAYLQNKVNRGNNNLIMVLGHDHHSYVTRLQGLLQALHLQDKASLEIILYQLVKIKASGELVRMSKRAGTIVTLDDVLQTVGVDVARFFYLNRKADAQLEFDLDLALKKNDENPVFYIQYAYVRTGSILSKAAAQALYPSLENSIYDFLPLELLLIKKIVALKALLTDITTTQQTHLLAYYTVEFAQLFSKYYGAHKIIDLEQVATSQLRLSLITIIRDTLGVCFDIMGVSKPDLM